MSAGSANSHKLFPSGDWFLIAMESDETSPTSDTEEEEAIGFAAIFMIAFVIVSTIFTAEILYIKY